MRVSTIVTPGLAIIAMSVAVATGGADLAAQEPASPQALFEAGRYDEALRAIDEARTRTGTSPEAAYLAVQVLDRLERPAQARTEIDGLSQFGEVWRAIGDSARDVLDGNLPPAIEAGTRATTLAPDLFYAHYQLGLAQRAAEHWQAAADAFERATQIKPDFAYAHYYAGQAYSRVQRIDRTAEHFQYFLKLAPMAPERLAVESIMRTLRGR